MFGGAKGKLLDVGCGDGAITRMIAHEKELELYGIDVSDENLKTAQKHGIKTKKVDLNSKELPFPDGYFDYVFAGEVVEHIFDSENIVSEFNRILKKDGILVLSVPNIAAWYNRGLLLLGYLPYWVEAGTKKSYGTPFGSPYGHVKAFTRRAITELLQDKNFEIEKTAGCTIHPEVFAKRGKHKFAIAFFKPFDRLFSSRVALSSNIIVRARKKSQ
jgi:methionine biosynthesis protein MetW